MSEVERLKDMVAQIADKNAQDIQVSLWKPIDMQFNCVYSIHFDDVHWIAKVFLAPDEFDDAPRREFAAMRLLAPYDIAPQAIHYEKHDDNQKPFVIYEYMEGTMWNRNSPTAFELNQLASLWLQMNSTPVEDLWLSRGMERTGEQIAEQFAIRFQDYASGQQPIFQRDKRRRKLYCGLGKNDLGYWMNYLG